MKRNPMTGLILILTGAIIQNFLWYVRLQKPILLEEFELYFARDGARLFLDFNVINYFFLCMALIVFMIFMLYDRRKKKLNDAEQKGDEQ